MLSARQWQNRGFFSTPTRDYTRIIIITVVIIYKFLRDADAYCARPRVSTETMNGCRRRNNVNFWTSTPFTTGGLFYFRPRR